MIGSLETIRNIIRLNKLSEFKSLISGSDKEEILRLCNIAYGQMSHLEFMRQCWGRKREMLVGIHTWYICKKIDIAFDNFRKGISSFLINLVCFRQGKLLSDDTTVPTPTGYKNHGDLVPGDKVFNINGTETTVLAISPSGYADREVVFSDGSKIKANSKHEWFVFDSRQRKWVILETDKMRDRLKCNRNYAFAVSGNMQINYSESDLPVHPYILGAWLGDGSTSKNCITIDKNDTAIVEKFDLLGYTEKTLCVHKNTGVHTYYFTKLYKDLKSNGFLNNKHIPEEYIYSSVEQRYELLAGLIDTDGYVDKTGRVNFSNTNKQIIDSVEIIVNSLGTKTSIYSTEPRTSTSGIIGRKKVYTLLFVPKFDLPNVIKRKKVVNIGNGCQKRSIVAINNIEPVSGRCIQVEGGIYLVGKKFIPTHNSEITTRFLPPHFLAEFPDREVIVTSHSTKNTNKFSRFGRNLIKSAKFKQLYPDIDISKENAGIEEWGIEGTEGLAQYFGILSGSAGTGGALIVTDDFFGGREDAESPTIRDKVWEAYTDNIFTRRDDPSINLITVTPWHTDDLVGRILQSMKKDVNATKYDIIRLPHKDPDENTVNDIAKLLKTEDDDELRENMQSELERYANGGYLFTAKYSDQWYIDMEKNLGGVTGYGTQSLMMVNPQNKGGKRFKTDNAKILTLEEFEEKTAGLRFVRAWDLASTVKQTKKTDPDYTAGVKIAVRFLTANVRGMYRAQVFIADVVRGRWLAPRRKDVIVDTAINDGLIRQGIETFGQYVDAYNELKSILRGIRVVMPIRMPKDKDSKSAPLETVFDDGEFYLLEGPWNKKYLDEFKEESSHDDQIDATAVGYHMHKPVQVGFQYEESLVL